MRAEPPSHAEAMPTMDRLSTSAKSGTIQEIPMPAAMPPTACTIPCSTLILFLREPREAYSVVPMYRMPEMTPAPKDRARQGAPRFLNFVAHDRRQLQPNQRETDHSERIQG